MTSVLRKPNHGHVFAAFNVEDVAAIKTMFASGFDAFQRDSRGFTCAMEAASRGHAQALHLALSLCKDPTRLALQKTEAGMDAFDLAAACGSTACMSVLSSHLPADYRSSIDRSLAWHAAEASSDEPSWADAWLTNLCLAGAPSDAEDALIHAHQLGWAEGVDRLAPFVAPLRRPKGPLPARAAPKERAWGAD
jgi:hypothetical protein